MCALVLSTACSAPPQKEIDRAQQAIDTARARRRRSVRARVVQRRRRPRSSSHTKPSTSATTASRSRAPSMRAIAHRRRPGQQPKNKAKARGASEAAVNTANAALMQLEARVKAAETAQVPASRAGSGAQRDQGRGSDPAKSTRAARGRELSRRHRHNRGSRRTDSLRDSGRGGCDHAAHRTPARTQTLRRGRKRRSAPGGAGHRRIFYTRVRRTEGAPEPRRSRAGRRSQITRARSR